MDDLCWSFSIKEVFKGNNKFGQIGVVEGLFFLDFLFFEFFDYVKKFFFYLNFFKGC